MSPKNQSRIVVIGAGLSGTLMAIYLGQRDYDVAVYEQLTNMRINPSQHSRSINMTLSARGLKALAEVGLLEEVVQASIPLGGRMVHALDGSLSFQPYGKDEREVLHAIRRDDLHAILLNHLQNLPNVKLLFGKECTRMDKKTGTVWLKDRQTGQEFNVIADLIIGADGAFSTIREQMQRGERANYQQEFLEWGYKEITLPSGPNSSFLMEKNALHMWARGKYLLLAFPNPDGSFTCTCMLPFEGKSSFLSLQTESDVLDYFRTFFCDVVPLIPDLPQTFLRNPIGNLITLQTYPWSYRNRVVLIGDACHAVLPFYGQGLNAACEDCSTLNSLIDLYEEDWQRIFNKYQELRKKNTDVLAELSKKNFIELRDKLESPTLLIHKKIDLTLNRLFPRAWIPLYTMISHTTMPYFEAQKRARRQNLFLLVLLGAVVLAAMIVPTRSNSTEIETLS